jgi:hypothetical protein
VVGIGLILVKKFPPVPCIDGQKVCVELEHILNRHSRGEETKAGDLQRMLGVRPSCAQTRLRKDEDLASLH